MGAIFNALTRPFILIPINVFGKSNFVLPFPPPLTTLILAHFLPNRPGIKPVIVSSAAQIRKFDLYAALAFKFQLKLQYKMD